MVDLDLARVVVAVWRAGSVSAAAGQLALSQGAVSVRLQNAEALLGRPLFTRHARGVRPTPACEALVREMTPHVDALDLAWAAAQGRHLRVTVHLGGPVDFLSACVLPRLTHRPLDLSFGLPGPLLKSAVAGDLDLVVSTVRPRGRGLQVEEVFEEELVWVGPPETTWAGGRWLAYAPGLPLISGYARATRRVAPRPELIAPDLRALATLVASGAGTTVLPHYLADGLHRLETLKTPITNTLWLATSDRRAHLAPVQAVREEIQESCRR